MTSAQRRRRSCRRRDPRGAAAVEFAIVSLLLITILFGILQYAVFFWSLQSGAHAAREAARQAAVGELDCAALDSAATDNARGTTGAVTVGRTYYSDTGMTSEVSPAVIGGVVRVTVTFDAINLNFPFLPLPNGGQVSEHGVARVENVTANSVSCS